MCVKKVGNFFFYGYRGGLFVSSIGSIVCDLCLCATFAQCYRKKTHNNTHGREITPKREKKVSLCFTLWNDQQLPWVYFVWRPIFIPNTRTHTFDLYSWIFPPNNNTNYFVFFQKGKRISTSTCLTFFWNQISNPVKKYKVHNVTSHMTFFQMISPNF